MSELPGAYITFAVPFSPCNIRAAIEEVTSAVKENWQRVGTCSSPAPVHELCPDAIWADCVEHKMRRVPGEDHMWASERSLFCFSPRSSYVCQLVVFKMRQEGLLGLSLFAAESCFVREDPDNRKCLLHIVERLRKRFPIEEVEIDDILMQDEDAAEITD